MTLQIFETLNLKTTLKSFVILSFFLNDFTKDNCIGSLFNSMKMYRESMHRRLLVNTRVISPNYYSSPLSHDVVMYRTLPKDHVKLKLTCFQPNPVVLPSTSWRDYLITLSVHSFCIRYQELHKTIPHTTKGKTM